MGQNPSSAQQAWIGWGVVCLVAILMAIVAAKFPYFPGDLPVSHLVQALVGDNVGWARFVTSSVSAPYNFLLVGVTVAVAWWLAGWRAAVLAIISFVVLWQAEPYLKALVARPRPAAALVHVFGSPSGTSYPSGFGLIYFSMFGYLALLAWRHPAKTVRWITFTGCSLLLLLGAGARIALGAHWLSDIYGAYLIGFVWVKLLILVGLRKPSSKYS